MKTKTIFYLIATLIIILVAFLAGHHSGRLQARQKCIDSVTENCDYICGVGADFYFPDQQGPRSDDEYELVNESMVAMKGDK